MSVFGGDGESEDGSLLMGWIVKDPASSPVQAV